MLGSLLLYGCGVALYYSSRENRRPGEEYGSAKWGNPKELNRKYMDHQHKDANIILTQRVRLGMDGYITQRNMNVLVVGGSGSGKTRFFCKTQYLQRELLLSYHRSQRRAAARGRRFVGSAGLRSPGVQPDRPQPVRRIQPLFVHSQRKRMC